MDIAETLIRKMMDDFDEQIHPKYYMVDAGYVGKVKIKDAPRFITAPFRGTPAFEKLYNQWTSVERTFGDLKDNYNLDNIRVTKVTRVKGFMGLSCIALLASRLSDVANKDNTMVA